MKRLNTEFVVILSISLLIITSCKKNDPFDFTVEPDPTGMKGMADSPWPCAGHDSRRSSLSPYVGPASEPIQTWIYATSPGIHSATVASPVIDEAGDLYIPAWVSFLKIDRTGNKIWSNEPGYYQNNMSTVAEDGTVYTAGYDQIGVQMYNPGLLIGYKPDGSVKWEYQPADRQEGGFWGAVAIGSNGNIYLTCQDASLYAFSSEGEGLWRFRLEASSYTDPAIASDGTIHITDTDDIVYAIKPDGTEKWRTGFEQDIRHGISVSPNGTTYCGTDKSLLAIAADGVLAWENDYNGGLRFRPSIDADGTILFGAEDSVFYAINPNGSMKWKYDAEAFIRSPATIDANGNSYFTLSNAGSGYKLLCLNNEGSLAWDIDIPFGGYGDVVLSENGTLYLSTQAGEIMAVR